MKGTVLALLAVTAAAALAAPVTSGTAAAPSRTVALFYYAWYGTPDRDGGWQHWNQRDRRPPGDLASAYYPSRGPYSSSDPALVRDQMEEIAALGVDTIVFSWWGQGSVEDRRLPRVTSAAVRVGLEVAIHVEPYDGRTAASVAADVDRLRNRGYQDFYVYDSIRESDEAWAAALAPLGGVRVFANTALVGKARRGGFHGIYTYDALVHSGAAFKRICRQARAAGLLCAPSVGPGFDARRAVGITDGRLRRDGTTYDTRWRAAIAATPEIVTVTSYNEWHEGTQIEAATLAAGYASYDGAYGRRGAASERAYLDRTRAWIDRYHERGPAPPPVPPVPLSFLP